MCIQPIRPYTCVFKLQVSYWCSLENGEVHERAYWFIVCEFGAFEDIFHDVCVRAIPT